MFLEQVALAERDALDRLIGPYSVGQFLHVLGPDLAIDEAQLLDGGVL